MEWIHMNENGLTTVASWLRCGPRSPLTARCGQAVRDKLCDNEGGEENDILRRLPHGHGRQLFASRCRRPSGLVRGRKAGAGSQSWSDVATGALAPIISSRRQLRSLNTPRCATQLAGCRRWKAGPRERSVPKQTFKH